MHFQLRASSDREVRVLNLRPIRNIGCIVLLMAFARVCGQAQRSYAADDAFLSEAIEPVQISDELSHAADDAFLSEAVERILSSNDLSGVDQPGGCYTSYFDAVRQHWSSLGPAQQRQLAPFFTRPDDPKSAYYRGNGLPEIYDTRHFRCHYTTEGPYAPPVEDISPANGVPDYVEIVAEAYEKSLYVQTHPDQMGYRVPPDDRWLRDNGGDERWDIYFFTGPWGAFTAGEYMVEVQGSTSAIYSSYFAANTRYYEWYGKFRGQKALQTTCAHEFFHAVQSAYNTYMYRWAKEMASTWVESRVYDGDELGETDGFDFYEVQLIHWFRHPDKALDTFNGRHEYGTVVFLLFLSEKFGDGVPEEIFREMIPGTFRYMANFRNVFSRRNTTLGNVFKEFTVWNALTDERAALRIRGDGRMPNDFHYRRSDEYPPIAIYEGDVHSHYPVQLAYTSQASPEHMSTKYVRLLPEHPGHAEDLVVRVDGDDITSRLDLSLLYMFGLSGWGAQVLQIDWDDSTVVVDEILPFFGSQEGQMTIRGFGDPIDEVILALSNLDTEFDDGTLSYAAGPPPEMAASDLVVSSDGNGLVSLRWDASGSEEIKGFRIVRKEAVISPLDPEEVYRSLHFLYGELLSPLAHLAVDIVGVVPSGQTSFVDSTALIGVVWKKPPYHYAVVPFDTWGLSGTAAFAPSVVAPEDTIPPTADLSVLKLAPGDLYLWLEVDEYLPRRSAPAISAFFPDGDSVTVEMEPVGGKLFASKYWGKELAFSPHMESGPITFSVRMEDKGGNEVKTLRSGRVFDYTKVEVPPVVVYPNPIGKDDERAIFDVGAQPEQKVVVRIYTISGELVRVLDGSGKAEWDVKNADKRRVQSGIYFFRVEVERSKRLGKIAVVD